MVTVGLDSQDLPREIHIMDDCNHLLLPGVKRVNIPTERVTVLIPEGLYAEMVEVMTRERKWVDRVEFVRQAVREKVDRWKAR
jgi:hypothetical protein